MKKLLLLFGLLSGVAHAQVSVQWESRFTGAGVNTDQASDMVIDAAGNVYVTGTSFNSGTGYDIVTVMYDNLGNQQWVATYDGSASLLDEGNALDIDASGNVYVTGLTYVSGTNADVVVLKYDNAGAQQWAQTYDYQGYFDQGRDIVLDAAANVYITGGGQWNASGTDTDYLIVKYNTNGVQQWADFFSTELGSPATQLDEGFKITLDATDNPIITGTSGGTVNSNNLDFVTVRYTSAGAFDWSHRYDYNGNFDTPTDIAVDGSGNIYVTGAAYFNALQDANYLTVKLNSAGAFQWAQDYNGTGSDYDKPNALVIDGAGNVYVTGRSFGATSAEDIYTIAYDPSGTVLWDEIYTTGGSYYDEGTDISLDPAGDIYITGYSFFPGTNNDYATLKYTAAGVFEWATRFNGPASNSDRALAMAIDPTGNIYVTGQSYDPSSGSDYSTIKYCQYLVDAGLNDTICVGDAVQLNGAGVGGQSFDWTVLSGDPISVGSNFTCNPCAAPEASPNVTTTYVLTSLNANGCEDTDTVTIVVNPLPGPNIYADTPTDFCDGDSVLLYTDQGLSGVLWSTTETTDTITVSTTGTYTLTVTDDMGCQNSTNQSVTVFNLPTIDAGMIDSLCLGDSTQLMASGGVSYEWWTDTTLSDTTITDPWSIPTVDTWYYVTGTDANGCKSSDSVEILVLPLPTPPVITRLGIQLISNYTSGNQWFLNGVPLGGETGQTYDFTMNGDYQVLYTDVNGCSSISDTLSILDVSIAEVAGGISKVYPNPASQMIMLEMDPSLVSMGDVVQIMDMSGRTVLSRVLNGENILTIQLQDMESGVYLIRLDGEASSKAHRLILQR